MDALQRTNTISTRMAAFANRLSTPLVIREIFDEHVSVKKIKATSAQGLEKQFS
jgi:hypothetical protein